MNPGLLFLPLILSLASAVLGLLGGPFWSRAVGLAGLLAQAVVGLAAAVASSSGPVLVVQAGGWAAPFGISLVLDPLAGLLLALSGLVSLVCGGLVWRQTSPSEGDRPVFPLLHLLLAGVNGAFLAGDLFNLYVWFEVLLSSSFVLLLWRGNLHTRAGLLRYVVPNLLGSACFLAAAGLLYGHLGTLQLADLAARAQAAGPAGLRLPLALLLLAFGMKAAFFPLHFWLPSSYPVAHPAITALFAALLTKVGVVALLRVLTGLFAPLAGEVREPLLWLSAATMVIGVLGAASQMHLSRILSFHIISQIGYLGFGLALGTAPALAATIFFLLHNAVVKTALLLLAGTIREARGTEDVRRLGGLAGAHPWLAGAFLVSAFSLAGFPPLSGFWGKLALLQAGFAEGAYAVTGIALLVSWLTLFSMTKIWNEAFAKPDPAEARGSGAAGPGAAAPWRTGSFLPGAALAVVGLALGLAGGPVWRSCERAAEVLRPTATAASSSLTWPEAVPVDARATGEEGTR